MKKVLPIIIAVICVVAIVIGCVFWYTTVTKQVDDTNNESQNEINVGESEEDDKTEEQIPSEPIFTLENYPRVDASLAIHPLVDSIASNFLGVPEEDLNYEYSKGRTSDVYKNLIDGNVDVIFAAEPSEDDYAYAKSKGVELEVIPTTSSAFVFVVNSENPVDNLTLDEVVKIYKGEITNWKEVGGEDAEIIPYQRPNGSGSQTAMISLVMKDQDLMTAPSIKVVAGMDELVDAVAEYDNSKNSLGYSYFYYINTMYKRETIKMLAINGVTPNIETIKDGTYPIFTNGYIVTLKNIDKESNTSKWIGAVQSERGSKVIEAAGYVPVN
ncbi:MAG: substrate-binding domain-containing protein [Clostridia bacterium]|nr:substrate-binding domain-containing protein [Clostridia bacterium]